VNREKKALLSIGLITLFVFVVVWWVPTIPQDTAYHDFADCREIYSISNFWNVISNLPFLVVGLYALYKMYMLKSLVILDEIKASYLLLFIGVTLVSFGSSYYHLDPNNETLLWDRLPMTIAFMALFSIIISEFLSLKIGKSLLLPLLFLGMGSVLYWFMGELSGAGDLRLYALVQFLPIIIMPIILFFFPSTFSLTRGYWYLMFCYVLAKFFEQFDSEVYEVLGFISGHSIKHMVAAFGLYILLRSFENRYQIK